MPKAGKYNFPFYDIDLVLGKLRIVHDRLRSDEMDRDVIAEILDMSSRGGGFANLITSLEKYGLIETAWGGKIKITELGKIAIYGLDDEHENAKNKAVSNIPLFFDIHSKYGTEVAEDQIRAFLRQEANIDVTRVQRVSKIVNRIYKNVSRYIIPIDASAQVTLPKPAGIERSEELVPPRDDGIPPLKIQYGGVYIQIPPNDLKAIALAKQALEFMEGVIKNETKNQ